LGVRIVHHLILRIALPVHPVPMDANSVLQMRALKSLLNPAATKKQLLKSAAEILKTKMRVDPVI
jgi:chaperonin GroEL (HSP60 family)